MPGILVRVIIAVFSCIIAFLLIPPVLRVIGLDVGGDVMTILKVCVGGIALFYIIWGATPSWANRT